MSIEKKDAWAHLKQQTTARVGQQKAGIHLATQEVLAFQLAHAKARDAVHATWDHRGLIQTVESCAHSCVLAHSNALSREQYLLEPELGRTLNTSSEKKLSTLCSEQKYDVCCVVSDGLSSTAIAQNFLPFWTLFCEEAKRFSLKISPLVLVPFGRVAVSDCVGQALGAKLSVIWIGERPGLSAADSMGIYVTHSPAFGRQNAERNCISNVREPHGLSYREGLESLMYLITESLKYGYSGTRLKLNDTHTRPDGFAGGAQSAVCSCGT